MDDKSKKAVIEKSTPVTSAERYLLQLCNHSFLSLWSYPGVYRDQGCDKGESGKEVCDLLVVFDNNIIIFSDKDCEYHDSGNILLDWRRWFKRAIQKSAEQVWGAERWLKNYPERLFLDRACSHLFPITLPNPNIATFHRIIVAHQASKRCRDKLGGSGSLMIIPRLIGNMHYLPKEEGGMPFAVGQIDPARGFIHVFDDTSLNIVMKTLDTISDFVGYLSAKEKFISSGKLGAAAGEEELLAYYLQHTNEAKEHAFSVPSDITGIVIDEGLWEAFKNHPQRLAQLEANRISYLWDGLIEQFCKHLIGGTSLRTYPATVKDQEKIFRFLARESRTRRRMLAIAIVDLIKNTSQTQKRTRIVVPSQTGDPYYIFLILPKLDEVQYEDYRTVRERLLVNYCKVLKLKFPDAKDIIGIATEPDLGLRFRSEDAVYLDATTITDEQMAEARAIYDELGLLKELEKIETKVKEYPDVIEPKMQKKERIVKGRDRNIPCPCGSGRKYKKCCGIL
jgi:hypothetical protein